jgi:hypothetical protein
LVILYRKTDWSVLHSIVKIYALSDRLFAELDSLADVTTKTPRAREGSGSRVCHDILESGGGAGLYRPETLPDQRAN